MKCSSIAVVLREGSGEAMGAIQLVGGTKVEVLCLGCVEYGIDTGFRG